MESLFDLLNEGSYHYHYEDGVLSFLDERIGDITTSYFNFKLYDAIRQTQFKVLDLSSLQNVPSVIGGFEYIEEVRLPVLRNSIPEIKDCPRLKKVIFDAQSITKLSENSFRGWPKINNISFGPQLRVVESFGLSGEFENVDFSKCTHLSLREHAFQRSNIKHIILPLHIKSFGDYLFFNCNNLESIDAKGVKEAKYNTFGDVCNLMNIKVSPEYCRDSFHRCLKNVLSSRELKSGFIVDSDEVYSYVWSITDFNFYYSKKINQYDELIHFYIDKSKKIECLEDSIILHEESDNYYIKEFIRDQPSFSERYTRQGRDGIYILPPENLQLKALDSLLKLKEFTTKDIRDMISEITMTVKSLCIDSIIDSYKTTVDEHSISKVGGDDRFYSTKIIGSSYTDEYLETLLPSSHSKFQDSGYTTNWPWTTKEQRDDYARKDSEIRDNARKKYSQNDHITFLIKKYLEKLVQMSIEVEQYLHINRAKEIALQFRHLTGLSRVLAFNSMRL